MAKKSRMQVPPGRSTPDNPFVLGYGISQKLPPLSLINPNANTKATPRFFIPKSFEVTTTPGTFDKGGTSAGYTNGTLNFNMLTHRSYKPGTQEEMPGRVVDTKLNPSAGVFSQTLFDTTKTAAHDGVMGFSQDLIMKNWIEGTIAPLLFIDPTKFNSLLGASYKTLSRGTKDTSPTSFTWTCDFITKMSDGGYSSPIYSSRKWSQGSFSSFPRSKH